MPSSRVTFLEHNNQATVMPSLSSAIARRPFAIVLPTLVVGLLAVGMLRGQTIIKRHVVASGGGEAASAGHTTRGTISQSATGRLTHAVDDRHDAGFWYWAYKPTATVVVALPTIDAEVGTRVTLPMTLTMTDATADFLPRAFHARIRFNSTLLHPVAGTPACIADTGDCVLRIDGIADAGADVIARLEFIVALGDSEATPLKIEDFKWEKTGEERIATVRRDGLVNLLGVCRVGGQVRLIRSGAFASRVRASPNPSHGRTTLEFVAAEDGPVEIRLVDLLGNDVARLIETNAEAERLYRSEVDLDAIASGSYVIVYRTPTQVLTERLVIAR